MTHGTRLLRKIGWTLLTGFISFAKTKVIPMGSVDNYFVGLFAPGYFPDYIIGFIVSSGHP